MHMIKKWFGSPRGRRIDRGKVAMAAAAALLLLATSASAGIVDMGLDEAASSLSYAGSTVDLSFALKGAPPGTVVVPYTASTNFAGNGANGLVAHYAGHMYVDLDNLGTIQMQDNGAGYQRATGSAPVTWARGAYIPNFNPSDTSESPQGSPSGSYPNPNFGGAPVDLGNYGITVSAVGAFARVWDLSISPSADQAPNGPQPMVQGPAGVYTFALAPLIWEMASGYQGLVSGLGNDLTALGNALGAGIGFPIPLGGDLDSTGLGPAFTPNGSTGVWDSNTQTLTLNVNGSVRYTLDSGAKIYDKRVVSGTLVYHPTPEPSTMILAGCGVAGLLGLAVRSRKHRQEGGNYVS
jgi:hypothetical protein